MGKVYELDMSPINAAAHGLHQANPGRVAGCAAVAVDEKGVYSTSYCEMTAEQILACAEALRAQAIDMLLDREDPP